MTPISIEETAAFLTQCKDAYILIHRSPDGDCIGSGYSLQAVLKQFGIRSRVLCDDPIPHRFGYLLPDEEEEDFEPQCILSVDVADEALFGSLQERFAGKVDLCVDHHVSNNGYAARLLVEPEASAACEVLYKVYRAMGVKMNKQIAMCLYTGIATDTGCFKYSNASADTHLIVSEIMREFPHIRYDLINREMFTVKTRGQLAAETFMLRNMEYHADGRITIVWATKAICEQHGVDVKDMEGLTSLGLQPEGVEVGITVRERENGEFKVSMRSARDVNVSAICQSLGGGGHVKAAGCTVSGTIDEMRRTLLAAVEAVL
ncbi:MAG: bifunctional oligoribonuclease/PAP phosphatase NrnA [Oscillospiraceae bacterium]|nr:bifunctional oligoribonuclease/PAP phosphatase NrnA [Oscillospiraceae bacterium]